MNEEFTVQELGIVSKALHRYIMDLCDDVAYEDDSVIYALNDAIDVYKKVADYRKEQEI